MNDQSPIDAITRPHTDECMSFLSTCQVSPHLEDLSLYIYNLCIYISKNRLSLESQMKWIPADARVESFTLDVADRKNGVTIVLWEAKLESLPLMQD